MQKKSFRFDKQVCVGKPLNLGICSKSLGNFEGILGNPGEIPHIGWKTLGVNGSLSKILGLKIVFRAV